MKPSIPKEMQGLFYYFKQAPVYMEFIGVLIYDTVFQSLKLVSQLHMVWFNALVTARSVIGYEVESSAVFQMWCRRSFFADQMPVSKRLLSW